MRVDLDEVIVALAGEVLCRHHRSLAKHRTICDPIHAAERDALPIVAAAIGPHDDREVEVRDLTTYDRALGVA